MPIYEFKCLKCKADFETLVFRSNDKVTCPHCESDELERLMSSCAHVTGGGGGGESYAPSSGASASSGCASCAGGDCSSCH